MERLTTNKNVSKMGMYELAHNSCYYKDGVARYRDFENDMDARDLARELAWSLTDLELSRNNECFDEEMIKNLQYDIMKEPIGLIALFYRNLWAMADLRERLKEYEDADEQGLLLRLPCKVGDTVWVITSPFNVFEGIEYNENLRDECYESFISSVTFYKNSVQYRINAKVTNHFISAYYYEQDFGKTIFLTRAEAEQKLKEMESD